VGQYTRDTAVDSSIRRSRARFCNKPNLHRIFLSITLLVSFIPSSTAGQQSAQIRTTHIRVNQLGYDPTAAKLAVAFADGLLPDRFSVVDIQTQRAVFTGVAKPLPGRWGVFDHHAELDFSRLKTPGQYLISFNDSRSPQFEIRPAVYRNLPDQSLEFMRQQRCGYNPWVDAVCHSFDGRTAHGPLPAGTYLNATGGWHDAGDLLKYLLTSSNASAQLLLAYEITRPSARSRVFKDRLNAWGQPRANGIPDLLDEARWGLEWMLRLHPDPEQLYHQVADDRDHRGWRLPQNENVDYGWGPGSFRVVYFADGKPQGLRQYKSESNGVANLAGRYAAAMALGYQIWKRDAQLKNYAQTLLRAGREVYSLGKAKEGVQQGNSYGAPSRYAETTWADDMEWGAAELFRATGEQEFLNDAKRYARLAASESWMGREEAGHYQFYPFMNLGHFRLYDLVQQSTKKVLAGYYREGLDRTVRAGQNNPYNIGVPFIWCSNNLVVALATQALLYERMTGDSRYREFAAKQTDWLLGRNPWGTSMITGIPAGGVYPRDVHLMTVAILKRPVAGGLVDGPVYRKIFQSLRGVSITEPDPLAPFQDERAVYHDDIKDYSSNEPTMDGTASAILLWALKAGR
jgi:endoglucanase